MRCNNFACDGVELVDVGSLSYKTAIESMMAASNAGERTVDDLLKAE